MSRPIRADPMLRTARRLAGHGAGPGRPALCDLRRATSSAYYALFHQLTRHGVAAALPGADEEDIALVARWFSHQGIRVASDAVLKAGGTVEAASPTVVMFLLSTGRPVPAELTLLARRFKELQDARHEADYDNAYRPVRQLTARDVERAAGAVQLAESLWRGGESSRPERRAAHDAYRRFLLLALLSSGGPKSRR